LRAGVSRQQVAAVEAGRNVPAVDAAVRIAHALSSSVEELFAPSGAPDSIIGALGDPVRDGALLRLGRVGDLVVAAELADHGIAGAGWAKPDGLARDGRVQMFEGADVAGAVIAGCDPALGIAEQMLSGLGPRSLLAISAPTGVALRALERGSVHAAVVHDRRGKLPSPPIPVARWHLARWQVGLGLPPRFQGGSVRFESVVGGDLPLVQRVRAAGSQRALERALAAAGRDRPPPGPIASGHLDAARAAIAVDGGAVTTESAARAFGLRFLALEEHTVEVWVAEQWLAEPGIDALLELLTRRGFTERVAHFGGYDLEGCGARIAA
jgi:DNA-binding XRE family transcriptional regulator